MQGHSVRIDSQLDAQGNSISEAYSDGVLVAEIFRKTPAATWNDLFSDTSTFRKTDYGPKGIVAVTDVVNGRSAGSVSVNADGTRTVTKRLEDRVVTRSLSGDDVRWEMVTYDTGAKYEARYRNGQIYETETSSPGGVRFLTNTANLNNQFTIATDASGHSTELHFDRSGNKLSKIEKLTSGVARTTTYVTNGWNRTTNQNSTLLLDEAARDSGAYYRRTAYKDGWSISEIYRDGLLSSQTAERNDNGKTLTSTTTYTQYDSPRHPFGFPRQSFVAYGEKTQIFREDGREVLGFYGEYLTTPNPVPTLPADTMRGEVAFSLGVVDDYIVKPLTRAYETFTPESIRNQLGQFSEAWRTKYDSAVNVISQVTSILSGPISSIGNVNWGDLAKAAKVNFETIKSDAKDLPAKIGTAGQSVSSFLGVADFALPPFPSSGDLIAIASERLTTFGGAILTGVLRTRDEIVAAGERATEYTKEKILAPLDQERKHWAGIDWSDPKTYGPRNDWYGRILSATIRPAGDGQYTVQVSVANAGDVEHINVDVVCNGQIEQTIVLNGKDGTEYSREFTFKPQQPNGTYTFSIGLQEDGQVRDTNRTNAVTLPITEERFILGDRRANAPNASSATSNGYGNSNTPVYQPGTPFIAAISVEEMADPDLYSLKVSTLDLNAGDRIQVVVKNPDGQPRTIWYDVPSTLRLADNGGGFNNCVIPIPLGSSGATDYVEVSCFRDGLQLSRTENVTVKFDKTGIESATSVNNFQKDLDTLYQNLTVERFQKAFSDAWRPWIAENISAIGTNVIIGSLVFVPGAAGVVLPKLAINAGELSLSLTIKVFQKMIENMEREVRVDGTRILSHDQAVRLKGVVGIGESIVNLAKVASSSGNLDTVVNLLTASNSMVSNVLTFLDNEDAKPKEFDLAFSNVATTIVKPGEVAHVIFKIAAKH